MMPLDYHKVWSSMNDLEMVSSKICSAREILDSAIDALESGNREKTETLMCAADEFLQYYLEDFDRKFKVAWKETVTKLKNAEDDDAFNGWDGDTSQMPWAEHHLANYLLTQDRDSNFPGENTICNKDDKSPECQKSWNDLWEEHYYPEEVKKDKVVRWQLPVEEVKDADTDEFEYFINLPDDLLEAANLNEGDTVEWVDQNDGSYLLKKVKNNMTHDEMIAAGHTMTDDGFWIPPQNYRSEASDGTKSTIHKTAGSEGARG